MISRNRFIARKPFMTVAMVGHYGSVLRHTVSGRAGAGADRRGGVAADPPVPLPRGGVDHPPVLIRAASAAISATISPAGLIASMSGALSAPARRHISSKSPVESLVGMITLNLGMA